MNNIQINDDTLISDDEISDEEIGSCEMIDSLGVPKINLIQANLNDLLEIIPNFNTALELIEAVADPSQQGNVYEKLWTLIGVFGFCEQLIGVIDYVFFDENHNGGTTDQSEDILKTIVSSDTIEVFLTATYNKTLNKWKIPEGNIYDWNIEDIRLCKDRNLGGLIARHGSLVSEILNDTNLEQNLKVYDRHPEMCIITIQFEADAYNQLSSDIRDTNYGISFKTLLAMTGAKTAFQFPNEVAKFLALISGGNKYKDYPKGNKSIFNRILQHSIKHGSRTTLCNDSFTIMGWYLNANGIDSNICALSQNLERFAQNDLVLREFAFLALNNKSNQGSDIKTTINAHASKAKANGKRGLILLLGKKCNLGISIPLMDVVMLFNDSKSSDNIIQIMYRSMTEDEGKKFAYVVELSFGRLLNILSDIPIRQPLTTPQKIKYIIDSNLIHIDPDVFQTPESKSDLINRLVNYWRANPNNAIDRLLDRFSKEAPILELKDYKLLYKLFKPIKSKPSGTPKIPFDPDNFQDLTSGQKITQVVEDNLEEVAKVAEEVVEVAEVAEEVTEEIIEDSLEKRSLITDILFSIIRFASLMTMSDARYELNDILSRIEESPELKTIFDSQTMIWWGVRDIIIPLNKILRKYLTKDSITYLIISEIKMLVKTLKDDPKSLLNFIDSCLKPKDNEKKKFGEVFTPTCLINEMLDKLDQHYQKENHGKSVFSNKDYKWLDPATGMGNFPIIIYMRLMDGLKQEIQNDAERKKHILKNMLYMSELNKKNAFIVTQIFDAKKEELNLYNGDSLELNTNSEWNINRFDIIVGNPPYNKGGIRSRTGNLLAEGEEKNVTIWPAFIKKAFEWLKPNGYLTFINPLSWLKKSHALHNTMLEKHIVWLKLWDNIKSLATINGKIPISLFVLNNKLNINKHKTEIISEIQSKKLITTSNEYLNSKYSISLAFHSVFTKLVEFIETNGLQLKYKTKTIESSGDQIKIPLEYTIEDMWAVDTYLIKDGIQVKKATTLHPDANKRKLIISNKSSFKGVFIDEGKLGLTGSHKFYILGDNLELIKKMLDFEITNIIGHFTKYGQDFLDSDSFKYLPDIRKLEIVDITETDFYKMIGLSSTDIRLINDYLGHDKTTDEQELPLKKLNIPKPKLKIVTPKLNIPKPKIKIV